MHEQIIPLVSADIIGAGGPLPLPAVLGFLAIHSDAGPYVFVGVMSYLTSSVAIVTDAFFGSQDFRDGERSLHETSTFTAVQFSGGEPVEHLTGPAHRTVHAVRVGRQHRAHETQTPPTIRSSSAGYPLMMWIGGRVIRDVLLGLRMKPALGHSDALPFEEVLQLLGVDRTSGEKYVIYAEAQDPAKPGEPLGILIADEALNKGWRALLDRLLVASKDKWSGRHAKSAYRALSRVAER